MKEYIKPSVIRVRDESGTFIPVAAIRGEKGESGGPMWIRYADNADGTNFTVDWHKGQNYIGIMLGEDPSEDPSDYNWVELPKGETGPAGLAGSKGDKGDSVRFAYAREPYKRDTINQNGSVETSHNLEYSLTWEEGMTWLGLYKGSTEPSDKKDYTWIQLPKGDSGNDYRIRIQYAKKNVESIVKSTDLMYVARYSPLESYFYETNGFILATNVGEGKRYTPLTPTGRRTLFTNEDVYRTVDTQYANTAMYFIKQGESSILKQVKEYSPHNGYFTETGKTRSSHWSDTVAAPLTVIEGCFVYPDICTTVYCFKHPELKENVYYYVKNVNGEVTYPLLSKTVGLRTYQKTESVYSENELTRASVDGQLHNVPYLYTTDGVSSIYYIDIEDDLDITTRQYFQLSYSTGGTGITMVKWFTLLTGPNHEEEAFYIPTDIRIKTYESSDNERMTQLDVTSTNNQSPIYDYVDYILQESGGVKADSINVLISENMDIYESMEYYDTYNDNVDFMGIYIGTKTNIESYEYTWLRIKGSTGRTGGPVYIRYAKANTSGGSALIDVASVSETWSTGYEYIGIGLGADAGSDDENVYGDGRNSDGSIYNWIPLFKGVKGDKGDTGNPGLNGKDGKPSALLFRFSPFPNGVDYEGKPLMYSNRDAQPCPYVGICKTAYYDPDTNMAVTDNEDPSNFLWLELPDSESIEQYSALLSTVAGRTTVSIPTKSSEPIPVNEIALELYNTIESRIDTTEAVERNLESYRLNSRKNDNANIDKLNVAVGYMRELLKRIRTLEAQHPLLPSSGSVELPYFDYSNVEAENTPTNTSFSAHVKFNSNSRYDIYYMSTMCTNDSTVWVKLKAGYSSILSTDEVYLYRVPLDPTEETVKIQLSDSAYATSDGYYWYLLLKSSIEDQLLAPLNTTVPENLYDYLIIEREKPADA